MNVEQETCARRCLSAAENDSMIFPQVVATLMQAGFESYAVDVRWTSAIYYEPSGESRELRTHADAAPVAKRLHAGDLQDAIREAQAQAPGYRYLGFCRKAKAGCAAYIVSFAGR